MERNNGMGLAIVRQATSPGWMKLHVFSTVLRAPR